jgi:hypothetical protein
MFAGMVFAILSTDLDFVQDMTEVLLKAGGEVYWATSWEEYARIQQEGVAVEMCVVDPVYRLC